MFLNFITSDKIIIPAITIVVAIVVNKIIKKSIQKILDKNDNYKSKKKNTISILVSNIIKYAIILVALAICLSAWGVDISAIVTSIGVIGVVAGLALQDALKDIIAGCNIIMDDYFVVGDLVKINDFEGHVIDFGLKRTKIQNADGTVLIIANREISSVYNESMANTNLYLTFSASYDDKIDNVVDAMKEICEKISKLDKVIGNASYLGVDKLNDSSIDYMITLTCKSENRYGIKREINKIVKDVFDEKKISIPFPQIEVHNDK